MQEGEEAVGRAKMFVLRVLRASVEIEFRLVRTYTKTVRGRFEKVTGNPDSQQPNGRQFVRICLGIYL